MVTIEWMTVDGAVLTDVNDRVQVSYIHQINDSTFVRDVMVNPLRLEDSGTYICEAAVMGEFITSQAASKIASIIVNGKLTSIYTSVVLMSIYVIIIQGCHLPLTKTLN